jgi:DHA2 family multidrug resistance protein
MATLAIPVAADPAPKPIAPATPVFGPRLITGLVGVLLAAMTSGLNEHITDIAMTDVRGALSIGHDDGSWLTALYEAPQVSAMCFAPWCMVTFSMRRFTIAMALACAFLGFLIPFASDLPTLYLLRALQGLAAGCLPPMLMSAALRFLPPQFKLYGLAGYALTATFGPNLGTPLAVLWTEYTGWQWVFWQVIPLCAISAAAIAYGIPQDPMKLERFEKFDLPGLILGFVSISMMVIGLEQGDRLDWFNSTLICWLLGGGVVLFACFLVNEQFFQANPFVSMSLLKGKNFRHALITLAGVLIVLGGTSVIPFEYLVEVRGYRPLQVAPLALIVALPQLIALPLTAAILNVHRVDNRWVLATGLGLICLACYLGSFMTSDWIRDNFYLIQMLQIMGQPMAVLPLLLSATTGLKPTDGPFASPVFNTVKGFSGALATGVIAALSTAREHFHSNMLVGHLAAQPPMVRDAIGHDSHALAAIAERLRAQAVTLTAADLYLVMAAISAGLILIIPFMTTRVYPPRAVPLPLTK